MSEKEKPTPRPRGRPTDKDRTVWEPLNVDPVQLARAVLQPPKKRSASQNDSKQPGR